uniref:Gfo/Idh/MocA family oxidoreductase n=1 Tax=Proteiniclasticum ruminis TaxID=398199 RepID=UPI002899DDAE
KILKITKLQEPEEDFSRKTEALFAHVPGTSLVKEFEQLKDKEEHVRTIENFIQALQGKEEIQCSLEEALKSITLVNAAYLSHFTGKKVSTDFSMEEYDRELQRKIQEERALKEL